YFESKDFVKKQLIICSGFGTSKTIFVNKHKDQFLDIDSLLTDKEKEQLAIYCNLADWQNVNKIYNKIISKYNEHKPLLGTLIRANIGKKLI
ncbi:3655_t:CDS:1, partial [Cetraspora pellucida]